MTGPVDLDAARVLFDRAFMEPENREIAFLVVAEVEALRETVERLESARQEAEDVAFDASQDALAQRETVRLARLMAHSPGRAPHNILRDVRGALGLDRDTGERA